MTADLTKRTFVATQFWPQNCDMKKKSDHSTRQAMEACTWCSLCQLSNNSKHRFSGEKNCVAPKVRVVRSAVIPSVTTLSITRWGSESIVYACHLPEDGSGSSGFKHTTDKSLASTQVALLVLPSQSSWWPKSTHTQIWEKDANTTEKGREQRNTWTHTHSKLYCNCFRARIALELLMMQTRKTHSIAISSHVALL